MPRLAAPAALALLAAVWLTGTGASCCVGDCGGGDGSFSGHGISFDYPKDWSERTIGSDEAQPNLQWSAAVGKDSLNFVLVSAYGLSQQVTPQFFQEQLGPIDDELRATLEAQGATIEDGPQQVTSSGKPGLRYSGTTTTDDGRTARHTWVALFDGSTEYFLNCQSVDAEGEDANHYAVSQACDQVLASFKIG